MARTLDEIRASRPEVDRAKVRATTEADIRRHAREDDSEPAAPLSEFVKRRPGQRGPGKRTPKQQITLRLDPLAIAAWKGSGPGWQSRLGEVVVREAPRSVALQAFGRGGSTVRALDRRTDATLQAAASKAVRHKA